MTDNKKKPSYLGHRKRLKKRFMSAGLDAFSDHEALELLLTYVIPRGDTKPMAWELVKRFKSFSRAVDAKPGELEEIKGLGPESAVFFSLIRAVMKRYFLETLKTKDIIKRPEDVARYCRASLEGEGDENFEVLFLTARNSLIAAERLSTGTIDRTAVYPRKIIETALKNRAAGLIFVHNHPSGEVSPSQEDERLTKELASAAHSVGITVHDHIIVGKGGHFSFRANGMLK